MKTILERFPENEMTTQKLSELVPQLKVKPITRDTVTLAELIRLAMPIPEMMTPVLPSLSELRAQWTERYAQSL